MNTFLKLIAFIQWVRSWIDWFARGTKSIAFRTGALLGMTRKDDEK